MIFFELMFLKYVFGNQITPLAIYHYRGANVKVALNKSRFHLTNVIKF